MPKLSTRHLELLKGRNFGVVATVDPNGRSQTSVVWVDTDGEHVIFNTTNARAKGRNLRRNPQVSITIIDHDDPYRYVEVEGPVSLDENGAVEHIHTLSERYEGRQFRTPVDRVIVRVTPRRILDYGFDD
jgi:PPOX class probable F420-dependent enzyme